jgi:DNA-binding PadR family transcriptional regulator
MKKKEISQLEYAILSLVAEKPVYGYEIEQIIQERGMREWTNIGFSSIYYLLQKMGIKGWVIGETSDSTKGLKRNIFAITEIGLQVCRKETMKALSEPHAVQNTFLLGLSNWPLLNYNQITSALNQNLKNLTQKKAELIIKKNHQEETIPLHVKILFDYSIISIQTQISWIEDILRTLPKNHSSLKILE